MLDGNVYVIILPDNMCTFDVFVHRRTMIVDSSGSLMRLLADPPVYKEISHLAYEQYTF
jgi:hypothetical protein